MLTGLVLRQGIGSLVHHMGQALRLAADWTGAAPMQASGLWCTTWGRRSVWRSS